MDIAKSPDGTIFVNLGPHLVPPIDGRVLRDHPARVVCYLGTRPAGITGTALVELVACCK